MLQVHLILFCNSFELLNEEINSSKEIELLVFSWVVTVLGLVVIYIHASKKLNNALIFHKRIFLQKILLHIQKISKIK